MNKKTLIIHIGIACLLATLTCLSYFNTRKRMLEVAERTFVEAVHQELDERWKKSGETITFSSGVEKNLYVDFTMKEEGGEKSYSLKDINYSQNVDKEFRERILHSVASDLSLECLPDTLQQIWQTFLKDCGMNVSSRVVISDAGKDVSTLGDSLLIDASFCPLPTYYAGILNEIQLNGFVRLSFWTILGFYPLPWVYVVLLSGWIVWMVWKVVSDNRRISVPSKKRYRLSNNVVYDPDLRCFIKGSERIMLSPKSSSIIKVLLEAENHQLHGADLLAQVWNSKETNMNKLHIQNTKLRKTFAKLGDGFDIISMDRSYFQLVFPYSNHTM